MPDDRSGGPVESLSDAADLDAFVSDHDVALVELYTEGCTMCQAMEPVLGGVARASEAAVAVCNPRDDPLLIDRFEVRSVPTLLLFVDGELVDRLAEGFVGVDRVLRFVAGHAPDAVPEQAE